MTRQFLGIDGGGSTTIARLEDAHGAELFERAAGPTNPQTTPLRELCRRFDDLLAGCPSPNALAACLAGVRSDETRGRVGAYFHDRYPTAILLLEPDYAAALRCFDPEPTVCVIAGTGSLVCSRGHDGALVTSGGQGYARDPGSGFRLGRALVERYAGDATGSGSPPDRVAAMAPVVCGAADDGRSWARALVDTEMDELAALVAAHGDRHHAGDGLSVGLVGGVWSSATARTSFETALRARWRGAVNVVAPVRSPQRAAVLLAREAAG